MIKYMPAMFSDEEFSVEKHRFVRFDFSELERRLLRDFTCAMCGRLIRQKGYVCRDERFRCKNCAFKVRGMHRLIWNAYPEDWELWECAVFK